MSIVLCILCLNVGVALGMVLSGIVREQREALDTDTSRRAVTD